MNKELEAEINLVVAAEDLVIAKERLEEALSGDDG